MRRALAAAGCLVVALLVTPMARPTAAQSSPAVTIDTFSPRCAAQGTRVTINVAGTTNGPSVSVVVYAPNGAAVTKDAPQASSGRWSSTSMAFTASQIGSYEVRATFSSARASAYLDVPCQAPTLEYEPPCFVVGSTSSVTMTARHFVPYSAGYTTYDVGGSEQQRRIRIPVDGHGTFAATFEVNPSDRGHPGEATDANRSLVATATWRPCPPPGVTTTTSTTTTVSVPTITTVPVTTTTTAPGTPTTSPVVTVPPTPGVVLSVVPPLGPPGFVAVARGTGFPPGPVALVWVQGIGTFGAIADATGAFEVPVLLFPRDRLGPRTLVATSGTISANAPFLVVPNTIQPSGKDVAQITRTRRLLQR